MRQSASRLKVGVAPVYRALKIRVGCGLDCGYRGIIIIICLEMLCTILKGYLANRPQGIMLQFCSLCYSKFPQKSLIMLIIIIFMLLIVIIIP